MNNEKEIEEMRDILVPIALFGNVDISEAAIALSRAGYGNVKQAVEEFAEELKSRNQVMVDVGYNSTLRRGVFIEDIDNLITKLYGEED